MSRRGNLSRLNEWETLREPLDENKDWKECMSNFLVSLRKLSVTETSSLKTILIASNKSNIISTNVSASQKIAIYVINDFIQFYEIG